jgi:CheY-like chemotaxis protein
VTARWRVLVVDDNAEIRAVIKQWLDGEPVAADGSTCIVDEEENLSAAIERLEGTQYDLVILDIRDDTLAEEVSPEDLHGDEATPADVGVEIAKEIRARRFAPIIFWSAVSQYAGEPNEPFVTVLSKTGDPEMLIDAVKRVFRSGLPAVHRALLNHVETVTRDFMAGFVEKNWPAMESAERKGDMAHLLSRRLGASLAGGGDVLAQSLQDEPAVDVGPTSTVHPMRYYIVPPVDDRFAGEILFGPRLLPPLGGDPSPSAECWYVVLTPSCDLAQSKAEFVVVAECMPFERCAEYEKHLAAKAKADAEGQPYTMSGSVRDGLLKVVKNTRSGRAADRDFFLPAAWDIPALLVDFQRSAHLPFADLDKYERRGQLDAPYAEALVAKGIRYLGRIGTPDLDFDALVDGL